jgi:hypothetical protein
MSERGRPGLGSATISVPFHFATTGSSRLNAIERWVLQLTSRQIRRESFNGRIGEGGQGVRRGLQQETASIRVDEVHGQDPAQVWRSTHA